MHRLWFPGKKLPQYELQDPAVTIVLRLLGSIDTNQSLEPDYFSVQRGTHGYLPTGGELLYCVADLTDFDHLVSAEPERLGRVTGQELQRQDPHAHEVRAMDTLVTLRDNCAHTEQKW